MKARHRRTLFFVILSVFLALFLAIITVPPMFNLKNLRPSFESALLNQTGINAKINGKINISLLRRAHIVAHDVVISNGKIDSVMFTIPLLKIFDINHAQFAGKIYVDGADIAIQDLNAKKIDSTIEISNSNIRFMDKRYKITDAILKNGNFNGWVRTSQHKYLIEKNGDSFSVTNKNEGLQINGALTDNGGARANMTIDTDDINAWFEFFEPKIYEHVSLTMNIDWDGKYGFNFSDINGTIGGDKFTGSVILPSDNGASTIKFSADDIDFDLSFLLSKRSILKNAKIDLDLNGTLQFANDYYSHARLSATGTNDKITINNLDFENKNIRGNINGDILATGAKNLNIRFTKDDAHIYCLFSGTPQIWRCDEYEYTNKKLGANGTIVVNNDLFKATLVSKNTMPENFDFASSLDFLGTEGLVTFRFADMGGEIKIANKQQTINYDFVKDKNLKWLNSDDFNFLPESMLDEPGFMKWTNGNFSFSPRSEIWNLRTENNGFILSGRSELELLHAFYPSLEIQFVNDFPYEISGKYSAPFINDLEFRMAGHIFRGNVNNQSITLKTDTLNLDLLANKDYFNNYEEMQFLSGAPILVPFKINRIGLSLRASDIIWRGEEYDNFVYSLRGETQDFSITDDARGSFLVSLKSIGNGYGIMAKLNRFAFIGKLLDSKSPLNISDSVITGQAQLTTSGKIAYDFWRNMKGLIELSFDGGNLIGIGTDDFYARALQITSTNAEDTIAYALTNGETKIKTLHINGEYEKGKFKTTQKFELAARHTEMIGDMQLEDGNLSAQIEILLRGTSVEPKPISLQVQSDGTRNYSLSEIIRSVDIGYLAEFIRTHNQF